MRKVAKHSERAEDGLTRLPLHRTSSQALEDSVFNPCIVLMLWAICCSPACTPAHYSEQAQMWWFVTLTSFACTQSSCMFHLFLCIIQNFTTANMRYAGLPRRRLMSMRDLGNRGTPDHLSDYQVIQPHRSALFLPLTRLQFH